MDSPTRPTMVFLPVIVCGLLAITGIVPANTAIPLGSPARRPNGGRDVSFPRNGQFDQEQSDQELDIGKWQRVKNEMGWVMKIPPGWEDKSVEGTVETSGDVYLVGPKSCSTQTSVCAWVTIRRYDPDAGISKKSLEAYLGMDGPASESIEFLNVSKRKFAGESAIDVCIRSKLNGVLESRKIVLKHSGALFEISYDEFEKDNRRPDIKSPKDWRYIGFFEKMLETFSFYK